MHDLMASDNGGYAELIRAFVLEHGDWHRPPEELDEAVPLLGGVLDSVGVAALVAMLESQLGVEIPDEDLDAANFATIGDVAALVERRRGPG